MPRYLAQLPPVIPVTESRRSAIVAARAYDLAARWVEDTEHTESDGARRIVVDVLRELAVLASFDRDTGDVLLLAPLGSVDEIWDAVVVAGQRLLDACPRSARVQDLPGPDRIARHLLGETAAFPTPGPQHHDAMLAVAGVFADETAALGREGDSPQWRVYRDLTIQSAHIAGVLKSGPAEYEKRYFEPIPSVFALTPPDLCAERMHDITQASDDATVKTVAALMHVALSVVSDALLGTAAVRPDGVGRDALQFAARTVSAVHQK